MNITPPVQSQNLPERRLLKEVVANFLREKIVAGEIKPGEVIVEGKWATQLGTAQASVREALHILASEGFIQKPHGRRAYVTNLTRDDVLHMYQVRATLEGLAARLAIERKADILPLEDSLEDFRKALESDVIKKATEADLKFHLTLCGLSGNEVLLEHAQRILTPIFAFVLIRVQPHYGGDIPWHSSWDFHRRFVEVLRFGDPLAAEQYIRQALIGYGQNAYDVWEQWAIEKP